MSLGIGIGIGIGSRTLPHVAAASAWAARARANGGSPSSVDIAAVTALAQAYLDAGLDDSNCRVNPFAGPDGDLACVRACLFRAGGADSDTAVGFVADDYTRVGGLVGDGANKWLETGIAQNAFAAASRHIGIYARDYGATTTRGFLGAEEASGVQRWGIINRTAADTVRYSSGSTFDGAEAASAGTGAVFGRGDATTSTLYVDGSEVDTTGVPAATPGTAPVMVFAIGRAAGAYSKSDAALGGYGFGSGITAAQVVALSTAWQVYATAMGREV